MEDDARLTRVTTVLGRDEIELGRIGGDAAAFEQTAPAADLVLARAPGRHAGGLGNGRMREREQAGRPRLCETCGRLRPTTVEVHGDLRAVRRPGQPAERRDVERVVGELPVVDQLVQRRRAREREARPRIRPPQRSERGHGC
jgi:hypothetical protein